MTALPPAIPTALLRSGYEAARTDWQLELARLHAGLAAQQHIATALGIDNAAQITRIMHDMERIATGLVRIDELIAELGADGEIVTTGGLL